MKYFSSTLLILMTLPFFTGCIIQEDDNKKEKPDKSIELSEVTSIYFPDHDSTNIKLLGFHVGISPLDIEGILSSNDKLELRSDNFGNNNWDHVQDISIVGSSKQILTFIWTDENKQFLEKIVVFNNFSKHLQGDMKKLLTFEAIDSTSKFTENTLGYPIRIETEETDDFSITTTYFYNNNIEVVHSNFLGDEWITLHISYPL